MAQHSYYVHPTRDEDQLNPWFLRVILLAFTAIFLMIFSLVALVAGYQFMTQDQIYPGVSPIYGVELSGMTRQEALLALSEGFAYDDEAVFIFQYGGQSWQYTAAELGVSFDVEGTVNEAYSVGRGDTLVGNLATQWQTWRDGYAIAPVIKYNQTTAQTVLNSIAQDYINRPGKDATLSLKEGQVLTTTSQVGLDVNVLATLDLLKQQILAMNTRSTITLVVTETRPQIASAEEAAAKLRTALDPRGVTFFVPAQYAGITAGPWTAKPVSIENMLRIERVENDDGTAYYDVYVTLDQAREFLNGLSPQLGQQPQNARFIFNDDTRQLEVIESGKNGLRLNVENTLTGFSDAVFSTAERIVPLVFDEAAPEFNDFTTGAELGITEKVIEATTYYYGSTAARRTNIQVAAANFHGIIIKPGAIFSFNEWLGDVSPATGYEQSLIIVGNQTITGVGGGVCQVSSTAFQAAFYGGYPIIERYPHGYRVGYYEAGEGPGMDATVYSPIVDFRFKNDTPYHLLIETYVFPGSSSATFKFYSTSMGRRVVKEGPIVRNQESPPPPIYRANPNFAPGQISQVDYAVDGAEVFIYRTVYQGDQIIINREEFYSRYIPWPAQFEVAPGDSRING